LEVLYCPVYETELNEHFEGRGRKKIIMLHLYTTWHTQQKNGSHTPENMVEYKDPSYWEKYPLYTNLNCVYYADLKSERSQDEYTRLKFGGKFQFCLSTTPILNIRLMNNIFFITIWIYTLLNVLHLFLYTNSFTSNKPTVLRTQTSQFRI
jgi:hypothetical protein